MDMKLKPFDFASAVAKAGLAPDGTRLARGGATAATTPVEKGGFQGAMAQALKSVSLEQTMVAMNKSQLGFQAVLTVRNRMVQAYTDVMNMQV